MYKSERDDLIQQPNHFLSHMVEFILRNIFDQLKPSIRHILGINKLINYYSSKAWNCLQTPAAFIIILCCNVQKYALTFYTNISFQQSIMKPFISNSRFQNVKCIFQICGEVIGGEFLVNQCNFTKSTISPFIQIVKTHCFLGECFLEWQASLMKI